MSEEFKEDKQNVPPAAQEDSEIMILIKGIKQQLSFLEKKIDTLIKQSQERPQKERHFPRPPYSKSFSKPFQSFGGSDHRGRAGHDKEGFGKKESGRQGDDNRGYGGPKKKPFYHGRKHRSQSR